MMITTTKGTKNPGSLNEDFLEFLLETVVEDSLFEESLPELFFATAVLLFLLLPVLFAAVVVCCEAVVDATVTVESVLPESDD